MEHFLTGLARLRVGAQVGERDLDACIQVGQLTHAAGNNVPLESRGGENGRVGPELLTCAALGGVAHHLHSIERLAFLVFLLIDMTVAVDLREHVGGQCVDTAHTYAVQTTGYFVGVLVELTTSVEHGHYDFECALVQLLVLVNGDASAIVLYGATAISIDGHFHFGAEACHGLVDTVVYSLVDEVVKSFLANVTNVHGRTFAHGLKTLQYLNIGG